MDLATIAGLALAAVGILVGFILDGGAIPSLINLPGFFIVILGTFGATMVSFPLDMILRMPKLAIATIVGKVTAHAEQMSVEIVRMAEKARREGLLSLEDDAQSIDDAFLRKGLMLMIDGTDPEALRAILEIDVDAVAGRHRENARMFEAAGGFAPTLGVLGAVMGLISVLSHLGGDTSELGHGIATAFTATFYGVGFANVVMLPMAEKLKVRSSEERIVREMMVEGILAIQAGDNPRIVKEKLESFLPPKARSSGDEAEGGAAEQAA